MSNDGSEILFGKRQAPLVYKAVDDLMTEVNNKIRMRGIAKGMVCIQEDMNKFCAKMQDCIYFASTNRDPAIRLKYIENCQSTIKLTWIRVRILLKQKALTVGEIGVLAKYAKEIERQLTAWHNATGKEIKYGQKL